VLASSMLVLTAVIAIDAVRRWVELRSGPRAGVPATALPVTETV